MMNSQIVANLLIVLLSTPLIGSLLLIFIKNKNEVLLSRLSRFISTFYALLVLLLMGFYLWGRQWNIELDFGFLYQSDHYEFPVVFYLAPVSLVYLGLTAFLLVTVVKFCRYYLHREQGFARFFTTLFIFIFGLSLMVTAGTLDLLFVGWEFVGMASFLLIGYYRHRSLPNRNALRAFSVYRFCDVGLLVSAWLTHSISHHANRIIYFQDTAQLAIQNGQGLTLLGLSILILLAASGKSAQFPFCFWIPRAMEGPTPSSAIFYGALSIHAGVFLLLRTSPLWIDNTWARIAIGTIGFLSALVASLSCRVQSTIKGQIGYASVAQVGLMLIELSFGWTQFVLFHLVANAFYRTYELLVSPSAVAELVRIQSLATNTGRMNAWSFESLLPKKLQTSLYLFSHHEGYLELLLRTAFWHPLKQLGKLTQKFDRSVIRILSFLFFIVLAITISKNSNPWISTLKYSLWVFAILAALSAFAERKSPRRAWDAAGFSILSLTLLVLSQHPQSKNEYLLFLAGFIPCWTMGRLCILFLTSKMKNLNLVDYSGSFQVYPLASSWLLVAAFGVSCFPITPAFLGVDALIHMSMKSNPYLCVSLIFILILSSISVIRLVGRITGGSYRASLQELL